jgi:lysophospholipase L1-like esterase
MNIPKSLTPRTFLTASLLCAGLLACESTPVGPDTATPPVESSAAPTTSGAPVEPRAAQQFPFRRILCFGDSLTLGITTRGLEGRFTLSPVEGYVPKLARLLRRELDATPKLINSGKGGEVTSAGIERFRSELRRHRPDLVLLLEGVVDVNNSNPRFAEARFNLKEMMRIAKGEGIAIIIGTVPPVSPDGFRNKGYENVPKLNDIIREEAEAERVPLADHAEAFGRNRSLQGPDGLHPNDAGYEVIAETWFQAISNLADKLET